MGKRWPFRKLTDFDRVVVHGYSDPYGGGRIFQQIQCFALTQVLQPVKGVDAGASLSDPALRRPP